MWDIQMQRLVGTTLIVIGASGLLSIIVLSIRDAVKLNRMRKEREKIASMSVKQSEIVKERFWVKVYVNGKLITKSREWLIVDKLNPSVLGKAVEGAGDFWKDKLACDFVNHRITKTVVTISLVKLVQTRKGKK